MSSGISVCITFCDMDVRFLNRSISMANSQTVKPDEILLAYSGIKGEIYHCESDIPIRKLKVSDKRVYQSIVRNHGGDNCNTDIISFWDVDDIVSNQKIEFVNYAINECGYDAFLHSYATDNNYQIPRFSNRSLSKIVEKEANCSNVKSECRSPVHHGHISVKSSVFEKIRQKEMWGEDGYFCQDLMDAGYSIAFSKNKLIIYYQHENNTSSSGSWRSHNM